MDKEDIKKFTYLAITILVTSFIFYNSFQDAETSSDASTQVLNSISSFFEKIGLELKMEELTLRKIAHFTEFFVLGVFLMLTFEAFYEKVLQIVIYPVFFGLLIPVMDEAIQLKSDGRVAAIEDVLLDFSGSVTGICCVCLGIYLYKRYLKDQKYKYKYKYRYGYKYKL